MSFPIGGSPHTPIPESTFPPSASAVEGVSTPTQSTTKSATIPESLVPLVWYATPAAGASNTSMNKPGVAASLGAILPFRGSIVALSLSGTAAKTTGAASFIVRKNGVATSAVLAWTNVQREVARFTKGTYGFERDDYIDIVFTTSSTYAPTTTIVEVIVWVTQDSAEAI